MPKKAASNKIAASKTIIDVKSSNKVRPSASARPILVSDHPAIAHDPMVVAEAADQLAGTATAPTVSRSAKRIQPVHDLSNTGAESEPATVPVADTEDPISEPTAVPAETPAVLTAAADDEVPAEEATKPATASHDPEADKRAAETEQAAALESRRQELEALVASGKYAVPINAVQRKRSRIFVLAMAVLAVVLAVAVVDALFDIGTIPAPDGLPHTHLFSSN